jgi:hypothetical protein
MPPPDSPAEAHVRAILNPRNYRPFQFDKQRPMPVIAKQSLVLNGQSYAPTVAGLGDRARGLRPAWLSMEDRVIATDAGKKGEKIIVPTGALSKVEANADWSGQYYSHYGPLRPEYELLEPFTLYDVEVFVQQAVRRRVSLMFRNGYSFNGTNDRLIRYINRRISQISYMMGTTWANFMREILTCLSLCSNCFLLKIRDSTASGGVANELNKNRTPVASYVMIPPHTIPSSSA